MLRRGWSAGPAERERLTRESRCAARLRHPGIVTVHEVLQLEGLPVLVCEFVTGPTLADAWRQQRPTPGQSAELLFQVAQAVQHAHQHGVIHRDLKPSNILLDDQGRPHVADFGLALRPCDDSSLTATGEVLGTPAYMAPEQARGEGHRVDGRCDVYSLGVLLYEALTGERPFRGNPGQVLRQVLEEEPPPPSRLDTTVPRDLESICQKAMSKEPAGRYPTAGGLADDLGRFLHGEPVQARPLGWLRRSCRWARRKPVLAGLALSLVAVALAGFAAVTWQWQSAEWHRRQAERNLATVLSQQQRLKEQFASTHQLADQLVGSNIHLLLSPPGATPDREFLAAAETYYRTFAERAREDPALDEERLLAGLALALLRQHQGYEEEALQRYQELIPQAERLVERKPDSHSARFLLMTALRVSGQLLWEKRCAARPGSTCSGLVS